MNYFSTLYAGEAIDELCDLLEDSITLDEQLRSLEDANHRQYSRARFDELLGELLKYIAGNFYVETAKHKYEYERTIIDRELLELMIVNLDKLPNTTADYAVRLFGHVANHLSYKNRYPLMEKIVERGDHILSHLCEYLLNSSRVAISASKILMICLEHQTIGRKIADLSTRNGKDCQLVYIELLKQIPEMRDFQSLVACFDFLRAFLLRHIATLEYIFTRDNAILIAELNTLLAASKANYWLRISTLNLFSELIQKRSLMGCFVRPYTASPKNLSLFYQLIQNWSETSVWHSREEYSRLLEVFRLFLLNPVAPKCNDTKQFLIANFDKIRTALEKADRFRCYSSWKPFKHEYKSVLNKFMEIVDKKDELNSFKSSGSSFG